MEFFQPGLFSRAQALASGYTDDDLRRARARGQLHTLRRGYFVRTEVFRTLTPQQQHLLLARAIYSESSDNAVFSHVSAAVLHRMETWAVPLDKVTLTIGRTYASKRGRQRTLHGSPLAEDDVVIVDGIRATTPERTVIDLARSLPVIPAVCIGDDAMRRQLTTYARLEEVLDLSRNRTGIARAREAVAAMHPHSRSLGESRSRMLLDTLPLPPPRLHHAVHDEDGQFVDTATFLYSDHGVIGEFDDELSAVSSLDVRRTRNRLDELGWVTVRWTWEDLSTPDVLTDRIARAFVTAAGLRAPRGSVHSPAD